MSTKCEIKFMNNPQASFYAGATVEGEVELTLGEKTSINGEKYSHNVLFIIICKMLIF